MASQTATEPEVRQCVDQEETITSVSAHGAVLRNYDDDVSSVNVRFRTGSSIKYCRRITLRPCASGILHVRLPRAGYRVEAGLDCGGHAEAVCVIGSRPSETALIEVGNGVVSITDSVF